MQFVGNRFRTTAPLKRKGPGYGVPDGVGEWFEWRQVAQTWETTNEKKQSNGWAIAVRPLHSSFGGPGGLCVRNGDLRGLWATLSPTHEVRRDAAVLPEVIYHVDIVRVGTGTRRELSDRTGGLVHFVGNRVRTTAPL